MLPRPSSDGDADASGAVSAATSPRHARNETLLSTATSDVRRPSKYARGRRSPQWRSAQGLGGEVDVGEVVVEVEGRADSAGADRGSNARCGQSLGRAAAGIQRDD